MSPKRVSSLFAIAALFASTTASAHPGHIGTGFGAGFVHPFLGWDHLLAAVAVGLWAARHEGGRVWVLPVVFLTAMTAGIGLGAAGVPLPGVEPAILASLVVLGAALAIPQRAPLGVAAVFLALFAIFHGHAHGAEVPAAAALETYGPGLLLATALLHAAGVIGGRLSHPWVVRLAGIAIGSAGLWMFAAS